MKPFNPFKPLFFVLPILLIMVGCEKKIIKTPSNNSEGRKGFFFTSNDSFKFSYKLGDTLTFFKYKSNSNEKLILIVNSIKRDTFNYLIDNESLSKYYEEYYQINFTELTNHSVKLDLYQLGENSIGYHGYLFYLNFNTLFYKAFFRSYIDSMTINNVNYYNVYKAVSGEVGDIPKNSQIFLNFEKGVIRIRTSNDEIWDLKG